MLAICLLTICKAANCHSIYKRGGETCPWTGNVDLIHDIISATVVSYLLAILFILDPKVRDDLGLCSSFHIHYIFSL
ncbi:hypothetical protein M434DRAFT_364277 [Hypoxylon sp. CO27-5]|nr:hypothetical protein M434DRAFT_364277 [Hypoxylon sp. CO27-5]